MPEEMDLTVILPSYLEEENLRVLLPRLRTVLSVLSNRHEVIVVDTETRMDHTKEVCEANQVKYINRKYGNAFGDAIRSGIAEASGKYIIFMDSDGSHEPEFIENLWRHRDDYDVVVASRYIDGGVTENSWLLILMSRILNVVYSTVLNIHCKDVSNSFKLYQSDELKKLKLFCNNFDIVEEILYKLSLQTSSFTIKEVPFVFRKRMFGTTKRSLFTFIVTYIYSIIKLRFFLPK